MAIAYRDFTPAVTGYRSFSTQYESLPQLVERANAWIAENSVTVINVETVILPRVIEEGGSKARYEFPRSTTVWQVLRVWHEVEA